MKSTLYPSPAETPLSTRDLLAGLSVVVIWGLNFVVVKYALRDLTPFQVGVGRYVFAALPFLLFVRPPAVQARWVLAFGMTQGVGQFGFLYIAMQIGMTAALASVLMQTQVFFTALLGYFLLHERIGRPGQWSLALAAVGIACFVLDFVVGSRDAGGTTLPGLLLTLAGASMWAASTIVSRMAQRRHPGHEPLQFIVWSSLVALGPFVLLSLAFDAPETRARWLDARPATWLCLVYLGGVATVMASGFWIAMLKRHPANRIAPFGLGVPVVGMTAGMLLLDERLTAWQWTGIVCVVAAMAAVVLGGRWAVRRDRAPR